MFVLFSLKKKPCSSSTAFLLFKLSSGKSSYLELITNIFNILREIICTFQEKELSLHRRIEINI